MLPEPNCWICVWSDSRPVPRTSVSGVFSGIARPDRLAAALEGLGAVVFGGLAFLNIWDFPWYVGLFASAHLLKRARQDGWRAAVDFLKRSSARSGSE